jgi:putative DNA primase/helicase
VLDTALQYLQRGWSVFPVAGKSQPLVKWDPLQERRATEAQLISWWNKWPDANIGVALGKVSNLLRIDCDGPQAEIELAKLGGLPPTLAFQSPSGGRGYLLTYLDGSVTRKLWKGAGEHEELRVQSDGAYTVLPPSVHPRGGCYSWLTDGDPAPVPRWLRDVFVGIALQDLERELRPTLRLPDRSEIVQALGHLHGDDYDDWLRVGMALRSCGEDYLEVWNEWSKRSEKYVLGECERKWNSFKPSGLTARSILYWATQAGWNPPTKHEPLTELGNARILARMAEGSIVHSHKWGWLAWDGKRWLREGAEKLVVEWQKKVLEYRLNRAIESLSRHLRTDASSDGYEKIRKRKMQTIANIRRHEDDHSVRGARSLASSEPVLSIDYRLFDRHTYFFNCANGTIDLQSGEIHPHNPNDWLTQISDIAYDTTAEAPTWLKFMEDVLPDAEVRDFVHKFLGSCLTGDVSAQIMPVFWGGGSNGKSTLLTAIMHVLGEDYAMKAKRDLLMVKRYNEHPTSVARLYGKRFVTCVETAESSRLDETLVKELTGGDTIAARRMREDEWQFEPTHKPVLATNHRPEVQGTDEAIWRRLPLVPFEQSFPVGDPRRDPMMPEKLKREAPGILLWLVRGCQAWLAAEKKLKNPKAVTEATQGYREEQDKLGAFLADCCIVGPDIRVRVEKLMEKYLAWCIRNKHHPMNGSAFGRTLSERGFPLNEKRGKYRTGIDIAPEA